MDIHTSTPLIVSKHGTNQPIQRKLDMFGHVNQQLFQNTSANDEKAENNNWDALDGPCSVEFNSGIFEPYDFYFDRRNSDNGTQPAKCQLFSPTSVETDNFISCFQNCSISKISEGTLDNTTLKGSVTVADGDNTLLSNFVSEIMPINNESDNKSNNKSTERRQSTTVRPFSFEMREKERLERKQARLQYQIISAQLAVNKFRAMPSSKSDVPRKIQNVMKKKVEKDTLNIKSGTSRETDKNIAQIFPTNSPSKFNVQPESNIVEIKIKKEQENIIENVAQLGCQKEIKDVGLNVNKKTEKIEPWKRKPFQVIIPKRPLTIPHSPKLLTAHRAQTRKLYEDRLLEKEKQELAIRKMKLSAQHQPVHKASPIRQYRHMPSTMHKRPLADPINPILAKRRRWI